MRGWAVCRSFMASAGLTLFTANPTHCGGSPICFASPSVSLPPRATGACASTTRVSPVLPPGCPAIGAGCPGAGGALAGAPVSMPVRTVFAVPPNARDLKRKDTGCLHAARREKAPSSHSGCAFIFSTVGFMTKSRSSGEHWSRRGLSATMSLSFCPAVSAITLSSTSWLSALSFAAPATAAAPPAAAAAFSFALFSMSH
mmetsp:Transcript_12848/g.40621  ORF Transcript_12848/g.40621 Transcript_12848/m.40621 type:complete len:200 (-) Transcript_12848:16-615(-)